MLKTILRGLLLVLLLFQTSYSQEVLDRIVAIIDDNIILQSELDQFAIQFALQNGLDPRKNPERFKALREKVLNQLVVQKVLLVKAKEDSVEIDENRVDKMLEQQINTMIDRLGSPDKLEEYFGTSLRRIRRNLRKEIEERALVETLQNLKFAQIPISRREVIEFYNTMKDSLPELPTRVHISHILISVQPSAEAKQRALKKIKEAQKKLQEGVAFDEVARQYSDDPGSASRGGDLGFTQRGDFVRPFEEVAFNLEPGDISDIVETQFGYHIIQLLDRRGEKIHARHILAAVPMTEEDERRTVQFMDSLRTAIIEGKISFAEAAKQFSRDETTKEKGGDLGWFELQQLQVEEFQQAVANLKPGEISRPIKTQFGYHLVLLNERKEARKLTLEQDWDRIAEFAQMRKRNQEFKRWVEEIKKDLYIKINKI
ncbi:MAG: peptidylprolyl isomerase [candidate division KSB1 bacterium]|nr:peptidylprolyl isomerase [candidate division KSB1 bacterium]MDQ7065491.1 peptidylprolyl isomerase [candidate division KSB1 bacterium]